MELARHFQRTEVVEFLKRQATWVGMFLSRWVRSGLEDSISEDELGITLAYWREQVCVPTDQPLPAGVDRFYFEVTFTPVQGSHQAKYPFGAIGFCTLGGLAIYFPECPPRDDAKSAVSWGYQGDDGRFFCSTDDNRRIPAVQAHLRYGPGDTIGCGVDLPKKQVWFTLNGKKLIKAHFS